MKHDYNYYITEPDKIEILTKREKEILMYFNNGQTTHDIADKLCISISAVKAHCSHIMEKMGCKNRIKLLHFAFENERYLRAF